jgi:hypothetical protein
MAPKSEKRSAAHTDVGDAKPALRRLPPRRPGCRLDVRRRRRPTGRSGGGVRFCARFKVFKRIGAFFCNPALPDRVKPLSLR